MTEITDILRVELAGLAGALDPHGVPLIVGGGYGLLLRQALGRLADAQARAPVNGVTSAGG